MAGRVTTMMFERIRRFLASGAGRRLRGAVAVLLLIGVPILVRIPIVRRHPILRGLQLLGGVALIGKLATAVRDWEPKAAIRIDHA